MTNKEAIHDIKKSLKVDGNSGDIILIKPLQPQTIDKIIKALKQEPILDKIRAEIQDVAFDSQEIDGEHESIMIVDLNDALNIIDKHKAESEENGNVN